MESHKKQLKRVVINDKRGKNNPKEPYKKTLNILEKVSMQSDLSNEPWTKEKIADIYPNLPDVRGYFVLLRIFEDGKEFLRDEQGNTTCIVKPEDFANREKYGHIVGLVVGMGDECYNRNPKPWANIGEWHIVDRYCGHQFTYEGIPFIRIIDEKVYTSVKDPAKVGRL